jgi:hypothetical protein
MEIITTIALIVAALFISLAILGYAAKQWRRLKKGR